MYRSIYNTAKTCQCFSLDDLGVKLFIYMAIHIEPHQDTCQLTRCSS